MTAWRTTSSGGTSTARTYVWDAENRLIEVRPTDDTEVDGNQKVEFAYDYIGRRVQKKVWTYDGQQWNLTDRRKFVWSGWLMLLELDGNNDVIRKYTWGLDLAGQSGGRTSGLSSLESAGGIGGLLAVHDAGESQDYLYLYDANGNVGQVLDWDAATLNDALVAHYEYDPYGNLTASDGDYADENPIRFSTKYWDDETGLGYWGYRYYSPGLGRWTNRDPIEEWESSLYAALDNDPLGHVDPLGQQAQSSAPTTQASLRIDVKTKQKTAGQCGNHDVQFVFSVLPKAPCDGYLVQEVDFELIVRKCSQSECTQSIARSKRRSKPYYEAFRVHKGDTVVLDGPKGVTFTDHTRSWRSAPGPDCGSGHANGTIRFFCDSVTGYLGEWHSKRGKWRPGRISWAKDLPSTAQKPKWWDKASLAQAKRNVTWSWDCCCGPVNTTLSVAP